jgi:hypothetical protein
MVLVSVAAAAAAASLFLLLLLLPLLLLPVMQLAMVNRDGASCAPQACHASILPFCQHRQPTCMAAPPCVYPCRTLLTRSSCRPL